MNKQWRTASHSSFTYCSWILIVHQKVFPFSILKSKRLLLNFSPATPRKKNFRQKLQIGEHKSSSSRNVQQQTSGLGSPIQSLDWLKWISLVCGKVFPRDLFSHMQEVECQHVLFSHSFQTFCIFCCNGLARWYSVIIHHFFFKELWPVHHYTRHIQD